MNVLGFVVQLGALVGIVDLDGVDGLFSAQIDGQKLACVGGGGTPRRCRMFSSTARSGPLPGRADEAQACLR